MVKSTKKNIKVNKNATNKIKYLTKPDNFSPAKINEAPTIGKGKIKKKAPTYLSKEGNEA